MMHLDAIVRRNRAPERQPTRGETEAFKIAGAMSRVQRNEMRRQHLARPVYVREV